MHIIHKLKDKIVVLIHSLLQNVASVFIVSQVLMLPKNHIAPIESSQHLLHTLGQAAVNSLKYTLVRIQSNASLH